MDLEGIFLGCSDLKVITEKFSTREFLLQTDEQYPQKILFTLVNSRTDLTAPYKIGAKIKVYFNINGREWVNSFGETKYYNSFIVWRIENLQNYINNNNNNNNNNSNYAINKPLNQDNIDYNEDLPF